MTWTRLEAADRRRGLLHSAMRLVTTALVLAGSISVAAWQYDPFAEARRLEVDGASLAYVVRGSGGTPLVFVHGSGADLRTFGYQLQYFEASRRVIVYSRRHHHPNAAPASGEEYRLADHVADLAAVIRRVADGQADVVGTSSGGLVALQLSATHPDLVRRLVLVEPVVSGLVDDPSDPVLAGLEAARNHLRNGGTEAALRRFVGAIIGPGTYDFMPATTRQMLLDNLPELAAEALAPLPGHDLVTCERLPRRRRPTLILSGGNSPRFFTAISRRAAACIEGAAHEVIAGAAHAVHAQQVEAFNRRVQAFLGD
jgi:pimeloyl-ACP methyl ester carboxylesterase